MAQDPASDSPEVKSGDFHSRSTGSLPSQRVPTPWPSAPASIQNPVRQVVTVPAQQENRWPEWVFMKVSWGNADMGKIPLQLVIHFGKHRRKVGGGEIEFGLSAGELHVQLRNATIPIESRKPETPLNVSVDKKVEKKSHTAHSSRPGEFKASVGVESGLPTTNIEVSVPSGSTTEWTEDETQAFARTEWQISTKGSEINPIWSFESLDGVPFLRGGWVADIGTVVVQAEPCSLAANFISSPRYMRIQDIDGVMAGWATRMQKAFGIGMYKELRSHLSRCELTYPGALP